MTNNLGPINDLVENLESISIWIELLPDIGSLKNEDDFMTLGIEAMNRCLYLMRVGVSLAKTKNESMNGFSKNKAIIVGHMVRLCKLYDGYCLHICKRQLELAGIFQRLIIETEIRMSYLLKKGTKACFDSYILASYRPEKETIADLNEKGRERELSPIEKRIRSTILKRLKEDKISQQKLSKNKVWNTDGKDTRAMLRDLGREYEYPYLFGASSRWVHGNCDSEVLCFWGYCLYFMLEHSGGKLGCVNH